MSDFSVTHRHIKSGKEYKLVGLGRTQSDLPMSDMAQVAIYLGPSGDYWCRPVSEFVSRFEELPASPVPLAVEFVSNANVAPGVAIAVHEGRVLFLGPAANMPADPRVANWPLGVIVNLHPQTYRKMAELAEKFSRKFEL